MYYTAYWLMLDGTPPTYNLLGGVFRFRFKYSNIGWSWEIKIRLPILKMIYLLADIWQIFTDKYLNTFWQVSKCFDLGWNSVYSRLTLDGTPPTHIFCLCLLCVTIPLTRLVLYLFQSRYTCTWSLIMSCEG